jgi:membrane protease YdiL (CAAX protease family)
MNNKNIVVVSTSSNTKINLILILSLYFLRLGMGFVYLSGTQFWIIPFYDILTYFLSALFIWLNRENLGKYHFDALAITIFLVFRSLLWITFDQFSHQWFTIPLNCLIALTLLIGLVKSGNYKFSNIKPINLLWFALGAIIGIIIGWFLSSFIYSLNGSGGYQIINSFTLSFISMLGTDSITEEPLFRGFLWGHLRDLGWNERRILFFQAFLFWTVHFYYWNRFPFFLIIPLLGILLGFLARRSKSIATSMAAHAGFNTLGLIGFLLK